MPIAERLAARRSAGTVSFAPVGTSPRDKAAWTTLPIESAGFVTFDESRDVIDGTVARIKAAADYSMPSRWAAGIDPVKWDAAIAAIISTPIINERSRPMGLTKEHKYTDKDGDFIVVKEPKGDPEGTVAYVKVEQDGDFAGVYVDVKSSIPLALNVLGYDRPTLGNGGIDAIVGEARAAGHVPGTPQQRDQDVADALAKLLSADVFDQRQAERKAADEAAAEEARIRSARNAKLVADLEAARKRLRDLSETVADHGVTTLRAEELAEAAAKYKAAYEAHAR